MTVFTVTGCSVPNRTAAPALAPVTPTSMDIPSIGVHADHLMALGLASDGTLETPSVKTPEIMGWYAKGYQPCRPGPFVAVGHIDGSHRKGILYHLAELKPGATVTVGLDNGKSCTYRVDRLRAVKKDQFPSQEVWGNTPDAQIRLISCGGPFVGGTTGYRDNIIAEGHLMGSTESP
jgi:hypothetical protein